MFDGKRVCIYTYAYAQTYLYSRLRQNGGLTVLYAQGAYRRIVKNEELKLSKCIPSYSKKKKRNQNRHCNCVFQGSIFDPVIRILRGGAIFDPVIAHHQPHPLDPKPRRFWPLCIPICGRHFALPLPPFRKEDVLLQHYTSP